jgi:hypothetical protein
MIGTQADLDVLQRERPEWEPWLAVVRAVHHEAQSSRWDRAVTTLADHTDPLMPLLADAVVSVEVRRIRRLLGKTPLAGLKVCPTDADVLALLAASVRHDHGYMAEAAKAAGVDEPAFQSVAALLAVPILQACHRQWGSRVAAHWIAGYCPVCASWPAFAEVCGIERSRYFRCGRCGDAWHARQLVCPYCGIADHNELTTLVPERAGSNATVETCTRCNGYVKTFTRLQPGKPAMVMIDDLASVDLDVAALERGYVRPAGPGRAFHVTVHEAGGGMFRWRT